MSEQVKEDIKKIVGKINEKRYMHKPFREYFSDCEVVIDPNTDVVFGEILWKDSGVQVGGIDKNAWYREIPVKLRVIASPKYLELPQEIRDSFWVHEINEALLIQNSRFFKLVNRLRKYFFVQKLATYLVHSYVDRENESMGYSSTSEILGVLKEHGMERKPKF